MPDLLVADRYGNLVNHARPPGKKKPKPIMGDAFGQWAGRDASLLTLPGGAMLSFDLSRLTLADFRAMRDHYQINASLSILSFILHEIEWQVECDDDEIATMIEGNIRDQWSVLVRALSQSLWAGFSANALNFANKDSYIRLDKIKDLIPEESSVHWKAINGWAPPGRVAPKLWEYDGINTRPVGGTIGTRGGTISLMPSQASIPVLNSLWYPLMMESGDYYGRKLLKSAFPSWYFSQLMHLFANRYYERFGEPVPVGRAPFGEDVEVDGTNQTGRDAMAGILQSLRNRSTVVLPSDRDPVTKDYDYDINYLESQMRGADFERYMQRLDEEMSLGLFTPTLLFRTADVGSYNLGEMHLRVFLWMLSTMAADWQTHIQIIVDRLHDFNFGVDAPPARWVFRKMAANDAVLFAQLLTAMVTAGTVKPDLDELGQSIGLTLHEIEQVVAPPTDPNAPPAKPAQSTKPAPKPTGKRGPSKNAAEVIDKALWRLGRTVEQSWGRSGTPSVTLGHKREFVDALVDGGMDRIDAGHTASAVYGKVNTWLEDILPLRRDVASDPLAFNEMVKRTVTDELAEVA